MGEVVSLARYTSTADTSATQIVTGLAEVDPTVALAAFVRVLSGLTADELRRARAQSAGASATLEGLSEDDLGELDLHLRHAYLIRARAQMWRISIETERELGRRLQRQPSEPGRRSKGETKATRADMRREFGLTAHRSRQLVELASLAKGKFTTAREQGLAALASGKQPKLSTLLRTAKTGGVPEGDEWSSTVLLVEAEVQTFGRRAGVDCASHFAAQAAVVKADRYYALEKPKIGRREKAWAETFGITSNDWAAARRSFGGVDGLLEEHPWVLASNPTLRGNVPYSRAGQDERGGVSAFCERLHRERLAHPELAYTWIMNMDPSKDDQQKLGAAGLQCQPGLRVPFLGLDGEPVKGNAFSQVIFGGGGGLDRERFREAYGPIGCVYQPAEPNVSIAHVVDLAGRGRVPEAAVRELLAKLGGPGRNGPHTP